MFWGLTLEPGRHYVKTVDWSFHVSMAAMDSKAALAAGVTQVKVKRGFSDFVLCTLVHGSLYQQSLDLVFGDGERVVFSADGRATIHLTGYFVPRNQLLHDSRSSPIISQENEDGMHFLSRCEEPYNSVGRQDADNSLRDRDQERRESREQMEERTDCISAEEGTDIEAVTEEDASECVVTVTVKEEPEEDSQNQNYASSEIPGGSKGQDDERGKEYAQHGAKADEMIELQSLHTPKRKQRKMLSPSQLPEQPRKTVVAFRGEEEHWTQGTSSGGRDLSISRKELYPTDSNSGWIDLNTSSSFNKNQGDGQQGMDDQIEILDETGDLVHVVEDPSPGSMNTPGYTHFKIKSQGMEHLSTKCSVCWNIFKTRAAFANHKCRVKHLRCKFCGKKYASKKGLMGHENNHMGLKPYPCRHCDECFTSSVFRTSHERKFHTGKSVFCCKFCAKVCIGAESLQKHENIHKGVRPFKCDTCESTFLIERDLKKHVEKKHHPDNWETENG